MADDVQLEEKETQGSADDAALTTPAVGGEEPVSVAAAPEEPEVSGLTAEPDVFSVEEMLGVVPETIRTYLMSDDISAKRTEIYDKHKLTDEERTIVMQAELEVFFGMMTINQFPDELWTRLPWKDEEEPRAKALAIDLIGKILLPAQAWVGNVVGVLEELGADLTQFPQEQLEIREVSYVDGAREIGDAINLGPMPDDMKKRLLHIIENRLRNIRDDFETEQMLTKSKKTGGMELPEEQAKAVIQTVQNHSRLVRFVERVEPDEKSKSKFSPAEIKKLYAGTPEEQKAISLRMEEIFRNTGKNEEKLRDHLFETIQPPDLTPAEPLAVVAAALTLAQEGDLLAAFDEDQRFKGLVRKFLEGKSKPEDADALEADPTDPKSVNFFLQIILRGFAGLDESESARFGLRILGIFRKQGRTEYGHLAAFDLDEGRFKWLSPEQF